MRNISDFFRTTSVSKLELQDCRVEDLFITEGMSLPKSLKTEDSFGEGMFFQNFELYLDSPV